MNDARRPQQDKAPGVGGASIDDTPNVQRSRASYDSAQQSTPSFEVFSIAIGDYESSGFERLEAETQVGRLLEVLADFPVRHSAWAHPNSHRDAAAVEERLRAWAEPIEPTSSVLYWVGHGWSDGVSAALAHSASPIAVRTFGITPQQLAEPARSRRASRDPNWAVVIVDACRSARFVQLMNSDLESDFESSERLLLIGVSSDGATALGRFTDMLRLSLYETFKGNIVIPLAALADDLERRLVGATVRQRRLGDASMVRANPPVASLSGSLDSMRYLEEILEDLPVDQRAHFIRKAQGADDGEIAWFFQGRLNESAAIARWLREEESGILIVTGPAGAGKSALLGHILVHTLPDLRKALLSRGLIDAPGPLESPPENVFDEVIHLSGLTASQAVARIALGAGIGSPPSVSDPSQGVAVDIDWLTSALESRRQPFTLLADALDESIAPVDMARSVLARLAALRNVRLVVGSRRTTKEDPDRRRNDGEDLLQPLRGPSEANISATVIELTREPSAIRSYVAHRLMYARDFGSTGLQVDNRKASDDEVMAVASQIGHLDREFLFARLAVYELLSRPNLLGKRKSRSLAKLLSGDHRTLFSTALERIGDEDDEFPLVLEALVVALSLACGKGLPINGEVWSTVAEAVADESNGPYPNARGSIYRAAMHALLERAQAYFAVDIEGGDTVYRLAHRLFVEEFSKHSEGERRTIELRISRHLLALAREQEPRTLHPYLERYLAVHVAAADTWEELAEQPKILDALDPREVTSAAIRTVFGRRVIPAPIAGVIGACADLVSADKSDRSGLRQLAMSRYSSDAPTVEQVDCWSVSDGEIGREAIHVQLRGHVGSVTCLTAVELPHGRIVMASAGDDGTIRLWDPATATPVGAPFTGHAGTVESLCLVRTSSGSALLASAGVDGTLRLWDPSSGQALRVIQLSRSKSLYCISSLPLISHGTFLVVGGDDGDIYTVDIENDESVVSVETGHSGRVWDLCALVTDGGEAVLVSGGYDGTIRLWNPYTGESLGDPILAHMGRVWALAPFTAPDGSTALASGGGDGLIRIWDVSTGAPIGEPLHGHSGPVWSLCAYPQPDGSSLLASAGGDGTIRTWNVLTHSQVGAAFRGHAGGIHALALYLGQGGQALLASAGDDGVVRLWDPSSAAAVSDPLDEPTPWVHALCTFALDGGAVQVAAALGDGLVELWDAAAATPAGTIQSGHDGRVRSVCAVRVAPGRVLIVSSGYDGTLRVLDPRMKLAVGDPIFSHRGRVFGVCTLAGFDGREYVASGGDDGIVRAWDPVGETRIGLPMSGHSGSVFAVCCVPQEDRPPLVASGGDDGTIRIWDPISGRETREPLVGHNGAIFGLCSFRGPANQTLIASAGDDGTIRIWDPTSTSPEHSKLVGHVGTVVAIVSIQRGEGSSLLVSSGDDGTLRIWDPEARTQICDAITGHVGTVVSVAAETLANGETVLVSGGADGTVRLWGLESLSPIGGPMGGQRRSVSGLSLSKRRHGADRILLGDGGSLFEWRQGQRLRPFHVTKTDAPVTALEKAGGVPGSSAVIVGHADGTLGFMDIDTGMYLSPRIRLAIGAILAVQRSQNGTFVFASGSEGAIAVAQLNSTGNSLSPGMTRLGAHRGSVRDLCLLENDAGECMVVSCGQDGMVRLWDGLNLQAAPRTFAGHIGWVWSVSAMAAANLENVVIVSGGADSTVRVWNTGEGDESLTLMGHTDQVRAVISAYSAQRNELLVSASHDGSIRLWSAIHGSPVHKITLGIPICSLRQEFFGEGASESTEIGARLIAGTRRGPISIDLGASLFARGPLPTIA